MGSSTSRFSQQQQGDVSSSRHEVEELRLDVDFALESRDEWKAKCEAEQRARETEVHRLKIEVARLQAKLALAGLPVRSIAGASGGTSDGCSMGCLVPGADDNQSSSDDTDFVLPPSPGSSIRRTLSATSPQRSLSEPASVASSPSISETPPGRQGRTPTANSRSELNDGGDGGDLLGGHAAEGHPAAFPGSLDHLKDFVVNTLPAYVTSHAQVEALQADVERAFKAFLDGRRRPCFKSYLSKHGCCPRTSRPCSFAHPNEKPSHAVLIAVRFLQKHLRTFEVQRREPFAPAGRGPRYASDAGNSRFSGTKGFGGWTLQAPTKRSLNILDGRPYQRRERDSKRSRRY